MKGNRTEYSIEAKSLYDRGVKVNNPKLFTGEKTLLAYETVKNNFINQFQALPTEQEKLVNLINKLYDLTLKHQIAVLPGVGDPIAGKIFMTRDPILLNIASKFLPQAVNSKDAESLWKNMKDAMLSHCKEIAPNENEKAKHQKELKDFERKILDSGLSTEEQGGILDILTAGSTFATTNSFKAITATLPRQESENDGLEIKRAAELAKKAEEDRLEELRINEARIIAEQEAAKIEQQKKAAELAKKIEEDRLEQLRIEKKLATKEAEDRAAEEKAKEKAEKLEQQKVLEEKTSIDKEMLDAKKAIEREIEKAIKETADLLPVRTVK